MELACNSYSLKTCTRSQAFRLMRRLGFSAVELWAGHVRDAEGEPGEIAEEAREQGLELRAYCAGGLFDLPPHEVARRLDRAIEIASGLGVDLVTGIVDRSSLGLVDRACSVARMRFAIENHWYAEIAKPADYEALASCSPAVGVNIDTGHFAFLGCDLIEVAERLGARTFNVHLKAVRPPGRIGLWRRRLNRAYRMDAALPGEGDGLNGFVAALRHTGYAGMLAIEHEAAELSLHDLEQWVARGLELTSVEHTEAA
ncbi:MAG: sugar phosphate isomerase/epimerase [Thermodesulfobacteriota bacterium]